MDILHKIDAASIIEGIPHPAMILDGSWRIVSMNRLFTALTGYRADEVYGLPGELAIRSNTGNHRGQLFAKVWQEGEALTVTGDLLDCCRRKVTIRYTIAPLNDQGGRRRGLLVMAEDLSTSQGDLHHELLPSASVELIGYSPKMQDVLKLIPLMAQTDASVMITGETGTGKDKVAEIIHKNSSRARYPFVKVNCGALPAGLLESELFGHVKGAFTGASRNKPGMFEMAHRGTLFLTEIGDMPLSLQVKLLSVLDDRTFVPVGGENKIEVDVRIIAATHRPLREEMQRTTFREDLFYRLHVLHVHLPPLRERAEDIRYLIDHFLAKFTRALGRPLVDLTPEAMQVLLRYTYPGNIRELRNIIEYAVNICRKKRIPADFLPPYLFEPPPAELSVQPAKGPPRERQQLVDPELSDNEPREDGLFSGRESWEEIEWQMIVDTLKKHRGNRMKTAASLGWGRMKLWRKMKHHRLI
ncbi:MAG: sigma 54-interacting transcriptional regulator [Desulforhopalus sp.]|jgi:PAS domain S-box-containing protein|nr:sigma 54-interacting transcriptional regulator [Desulforhopalus sp.]